MEPGRPAKTDKLAILDDAIRVLKQLKTEAQELKETNERLLEEIKCSKVSIFSTVYSGELYIAIYFLCLEHVFLEILFWVPASVLKSECSWKRK